MLLVKVSKLNQLDLVHTLTAYSCNIDFTFIQNFLEVLCLL